MVELSYLRVSKKYRNLFLAFCFYVILQRYRYSTANTIEGYNRQRLKAAVRNGNPVMIFEHKLLYGSKSKRAEKGRIDSSRYIPKEYSTVPIRKVEIVKTGSDVTIILTLLMLHKSKALKLRAFHVRSLI